MKGIKSSKIRIWGGICLLLFLAAGLWCWKRGVSGACEGAEGAEGAEEALLEDRRAGFLALRTVAQLEVFFEQNPALGTHFFDIYRYNEPLEQKKHWVRIAKDPHIDTLRKDVEAHYGDLSELRRTLGKVWRRVRAYDTAFVAPRVQTVISGLYKDVFFSDTLIVVGLDYFIGPLARYKPSLPLYLLKRYTPRHLVPGLLLRMSLRYNRTAVSDRSLLADMVSAGKAYAFAKSMMPCLPDSVFLGYSPKEMQDISEQEHVIWSYFLYNQLLYEQNPRLKEPFIGERPKVLEIGAACPGRIGRWVGWQVAKGYLAHHARAGNEALRALMAEPDARKILSLSRYNPKM